MIGAEEINMKYMGGDLELIFGLSEERIQELTNSEEENYLSMFKSIQRWSDELVATIKLIWIKGYDIPLKAWGEQCFSQIVSSFGTLVEIDESTKKFSKLDHA